MRSSPTNVPVVFLLVALSMGLAGCSGGSSGGGGNNKTAFRGVVANPADFLVAGATVYLVPADMIDLTPITAAGVLAGTTEGFDEPLEDLIAAAGGTFSQAVTDSEGEFKIKPVPDGRFFVFVQPGAGDLEHMPGGSMCRVSYDADELRGLDQPITVSSSAALGAGYVGMSTCLSCHNEYETEETLAHRLGFRVPGVSSNLQDTSEHPEIDDGLTLFLDAVDYTGGTPVYHYDYDSTRGFDKFKTSLTDPGANVSAILWVWRDTVALAYKITIENVGNPADPGNFAEREVKLTYGGAVYKQRYMVEWPGLNGLYPMLQYQTVGSDAIYDRTRQQFRDYHLDFYWDDGGTPSIIGDDLIKTPSITRNIQRNCMGCHASDYTQFTDLVTGEVLCDTLEDPGGEYDIDGDGLLNDLNTGCESCHGPGAGHVANNGAGGRFILTPEYLSQSRQVMICGRCHERQVGNGTVKNDHPLNPMDEFPLPGISRADYLASYVTRKGPASSSFWTDFEHSKSHHQQTPDFIKSSHYRNTEQLVTCWDCHNMHGGTGYEHGLVADPDAPDSPLCMNCHSDDITNTTEHTAAHLGVPHGSFVAKCTDCHMAKTAKTGAGEYAFQLSPPTGTSMDDDTAYFVNDITSHVFDVIPKDNVGVKGVQPTKAMPVPYTNACGTCHDPSNLPN